MYVGRIRLEFFSPAGEKNWFTREDTTKTSLYARYYPPPPPPQVRALEVPRHRADVSGRGEFWRFSRGARERAD